MYAIKLMEWEGHCIDYLPISRDATLLQLCSANAVQNKAHFVLEYPI